MISRKYVFSSSSCFIALVTVFLPVGYVFFSLFFVALPHFLLQVSRWNSTIGGVKTSVCASF